MWFTEYKSARLCTISQIFILPKNNINIYAVKLLNCPNRAFCSIGNCFHSISILFLGERRVPQKIHGQLLPNLHGHKFLRYKRQCFFGRVKYQQNYFQIIF
jgi:hypothetical protein